MPTERTCLVHLAPRTMLMRTLGKGSPATVHETDGPGAPFRIRRRDALTRQPARPIVRYYRSIAARHRLARPEPADRDSGGAVGATGRTGQASWQSVWSLPD